MTPPGVHAVLGRRVLYYHLESKVPQAAVITQVDSDGLFWLIVFDPDSGPLVRKRVAVIAPGQPAPLQDSYCTWLMEDPVDVQPRAPITVQDQGEDEDDDDDDFEDDDDDSDLFVVPGWVLTAAVNDLKTLRREVSLLWKAQGVQDEVLPEGELGEETIERLQEILDGEVRADKDDDDDEDDDVEGASV